MSYSSHADLRSIFASIDSLTARIDTPAFLGSLNDLTPSGTLSNPSDLDFEVIIDATGTPDTFKWSKTGGASFAASGIPISGAVQHLDNGISVTFAATTGHALNDQWDFRAYAPDSSAQRTLAYGWVNDHLRSMYDVPFASPPQSVILAEAYYAVYIILLANDDPSASTFLSEAESLIGLLSVSDINSINKGGSPISSTSGIDRKFSQGQYSSGLLIGKRGTLDDF